MFYPQYFADSFVLSIFIKDVEMSKNKKLLAPQNYLIFYAATGDTMSGGTAMHGKIAVARLG